MALELAPTTSPAVLALARVIWAALSGVKISAPKGWPFAPPSVDFSAEGDVTIVVQGATGLCTVRFADQGAPQVSGTLNLALLEAQLMGPPNFLNVANDGASGRPGAISGSSVSFGGAYSAITKQASGVMYVSGELSGTQSIQASVSIAMYRDAVSGPSSVLLGEWTLTPGGVGGTNYWSGSVSAIDELPDEQPHEYIIVATGTNGSTLTVPESVNGSAPANIQAFELGAPG